MVIQHAGGVDTFIHGMMARLVEAGYFVAAPDLFHRFDYRSAGMMDKLKQLRDAELELDVNATVEHLRGHPLVDAAGLGITGFSMGGRVSGQSHGRTEPALPHRGGLLRRQRYETLERRHLPVPQDMRKLDQELTRLGKAHEFHAYTGAGHPFRNFDNPERYRPAAAQASWPRTLGFFARHLA